MSMGTLADAIRTLTGRGYDDQFRAEGDGLRAVKADRSFDPRALRVDEVARFEGDSNPAEQTMVFALRSSDGVRGTYTVAHGPEMAEADAKVVRLLDDAPTA